MALSLFQDPFFFPSTRQLAQSGDDMRTMARLGACDIQETDNAHIFHVDVPGIKRDEVNIELKDNNVLLVSGQRQAKHETEDNEGHKWHRVERSYGSFSRAFHLPENSDVDNITANCDHGELVITVPKAPERQAKNRRIAIQ
eukprot:TRINITY_DN23893_c0_g1_i1.p1 TRINITY_DN23893_c0_g1~~TRINITY_DN23893_c0_g1_i1.p1  ORF type:complete len:142 (+),score=35.30 TRINITY_DN23893_c0_g1_i1:170-595(+)